MGERIASMSVCTRGYPPGSFFSFYASLLKKTPSGTRRGESAARGADPLRHGVVW